MVLQWMSTTRSKPLQPATELINSEVPGAHLGCHQLDNKSGRTELQVSTTGCKPSTEGTHQLYFYCNTCYGSRCARHTIRVTPTLVITSLFEPVVSPRDMLASAAE
jgi:hypothetical protein